MTDTIIIDAIILSLISGGAIFVGSFLASIEELSPKWLKQEYKYMIIAFGGGALISAIALVLIPEGIEKQSPLSAIITFIAGGIIFMELDKYLEKNKTSLSQLIAMMLDFIPEAIIVGAIIHSNFKEALLMAIIIFTQNLPESFNAYRELRESTSWSKRKILTSFLLISITGPIYIIFGTDILKNHDNILGMLMTFCAGGILYLLFNDISPKAKLKNHHFPAMGALFGFGIGIIGQLMIL